MIFFSVIPEYSFLVNSPILLGHQILACIFFHVNAYEFYDMTKKFV